MNPRHRTPRTLTVKQAKDCLPLGAIIHVYVASSNAVLIGSHWARGDVLARLERADSIEADEGALRNMRHGLVVRETAAATLFVAHGPRLDALPVRGDRFEDLEQRALEKLRDALNWPSMRDNWYVTAGEVAIDYAVMRGWMAEGASRSCLAQGPRAYHVTFEGRRAISIDPAGVCFDYARVAGDDDGCRFHRSIDSALEAYVAGHRVGLQLESVPEQLSVSLWRRQHRAEEDAVRLAEHLWAHLVDCVGKGIRAGPRGCGGADDGRSEERIEDVKHGLRQVCAKYLGLFEQENVEPFATVEVNVAEWIRAKRPDWLEVSSHLEVPSGFEREGRGR